MLLPTASDYHARARFAGSVMAGPVEATAPEGVDGNRRGGMGSLIFLTELVGLRVYDIKGRQIGRVRDAALVPLVDPRRIDR